MSDEQKAEPTLTPATPLSEAVGAAAFAGSPCMMAVISPELELLRVNEAFVRTFGPRAGEPCYRVLKDRIAVCEVCPVLRVFAEGVPCSVGEHGIDAHGAAIVYRVQAMPIFGNNGHIAQVLHMAQDVTRLEELEQGLEQAQRLAAVGLTVAGMAHTIKNILAGLEGGMYVVSSGLEHGNTERLKGGWTLVQKYIEQVTALVKNLLRYSRAEQPGRERVEPKALLDEVVELYAHKAVQSGVALVHIAEPDLPIIEVDREGLLSALTNLVNNAFDACVWDPDLDREHRIELRAAALPSGGVCFEVIDNGMGISLEHQSKILSAFFTTKGIRGTGLGLLLTRKTVQAHGGRISFVSTPGAGTTFRIELPGEKASEPPLGPPSPVTPSQPDRSEP